MQNDEKQIMQLLLGNAGPSKGDANADLELFYCIGHPKEIIVEEFNFGQPREK
jgi:nicotinamide-nucleotide amidase